MSGVKQGGGMRQRRWRWAALIGLVSIGVAGLGATQDNAPDPWLEAGFDEAQRQRIRSVIQRGIDEGSIAGASLLLYHDDIEVFREAFGWADLASKRPFTTDETVVLASISKPHTATTIMILVNQGKLGLDDRVDRYLPYYAELEHRDTGEPMPAPTIRQCLSHTAGFPGLRVAPMIPLLYAQPDFEAACRAIAKHGLAYRPGEGYAYTELDYVTVAHVAEKVTGKDFDDLMRELLLEPIGAAHTTFRPSQQVLDTMPTQYHLRDGTLVPTPGRRYRGPGTTFDPGGSLVGDLDGVARLLLLHFNRGRVNGRQLIRPELLERMYAVQPAADRYGLGFNLEWSPDDGSAPLVRHGGATGTMSWIDFELGIVGVFFTQTPARQVMPFTTRAFTTIAASGLGRMRETEIPGR
jgi:CubicO group peptidase (beta-lactamase class C family)